MKPSTEMTAVPATHKLEGLIAWTRREEWRDAMAGIFSRHVAKACAGAGLTMEDLPGILDSHVDSAIWGAAFEDLVASDLSDGRNIADDYLKRRGWKEPVATREYIAALRRSVISLYEVSDVVPGESMLLRDLVRPSEPVRVFEKSGSRGLHRWDRIGTRVINVRGGAVISGTLLTFDHDTSEQLLASLGRVGDKTGDMTVELAQELGRTVSAEAALAVLTPELLLGGAAFAFTNLWLASALRSHVDKTPPAIMNSDGDLLAFITLHFPLRPGVSVAAIRAALNAVPSLRQAASSFWNWRGPAAEAGKRPTHKQAGMQWITTMHDGAMILGNVEIAARKVTLSVNSEARAERARALFEPALHGLVLPPLAERQHLDQMLAEQRAGRQRPPPSGLPPEAERAIVLHHLEQHYRGVLDEPIPSPGNLSPRRAARTTKGREKVVTWLKALENHSANHPGKPIGDYDFGWMWQELGVAALRK